MDALKEGASITKPPLLEGVNYVYWRPRMRAFIKAMDEQSWLAVEQGWEPPMMTTTTSNGQDSKSKTLRKPVKLWTDYDLQLAHFNSKALNALFCAVDSKRFKLISSCESAKEAWTVLETAHLGTSSVRESKLQVLASRFENLKMSQNETVGDFFFRLCDIANEASLLGQPYSDLELMNKVLRSLVPKFAPKVTAIEEARGIESIALFELMASLQTFETRGM